MPELSLKFAGWFQRWWVAVLGAVVMVGGVVIYGSSSWSIPRGTTTYSASSNTYVAFLSPEFVALQRLGEALLVIGFLAVITTVAVRLIRRRT